MKRVLLITERGAAWPSGRIRALIYKDLFAADGIEARYITRHAPWLTRLVERLAQSNRPIFPRPALRMLAYLDERLARFRETQIVRLAQGFDTLYVQKGESFSLLAALQRTSRARLVYDLNDGVWLPSRASFADGKIRDLLRLADAVTCDNSFGLEFARAFNPRCYLVPDPPQVEQFDLHRARFPRPGAPVVLGWIGSPATAFNLYAIWEPLEVLFSRLSNLTLRLVGVGHNRQLLPPFEKVRCTTRPFYSQPEMIREVLQMDIGLFPLFEVEDSRVRGILKATVYMSGEACVIASPVGQNCDLIQDGENGLLAHTADEWLNRLMRLVEEASLRQRLAAAGLQTVREQFTVPHCYKSLLHALQGEA